MKQVTTAAEYQGLIRQELDVENLLRTTLEFMLGRGGPTNAAVFLPTSSGDWSLGAYVNYDCPKETADILLDHLANVVAPRFADLTDVLHLADDNALDVYIEGDADWLYGSSVMAFACRHDDEALAVFMIFRDSASPFSRSFLDEVGTVRQLFADQLARVIRIHHRHLPKDKWGTLTDIDTDADLDVDEDSDDWGMAA